MLITNRQAILCASFLGSMLRKGGVLTDIYELCDVDLKDFSLQGKYIFICRDYVSKARPAIKHFAFRPPIFLN